MWAYFNQTWRLWSFQQANGSLDDDHDSDDDGDSSYSTDCASDSDSSSSTVRVRDVAKWYMQGYLNKTWLKFLLLMGPIHWF